MGWIKHNGISVLIQDGASPADYGGLIGTATADMLQFRETWGDDETFAIKRRGDLYQLVRVNGEDQVIMGPVPGGKPKFPGVWMPKFPFEEMPVPAFDIFGPYNVFQGWYVNPGMQWNSPAYKFPADPDLSTASYSYDDDGQQFDSGSTFSYIADDRAFELFTLREIGTPDQEDGTYDSGTYDSGGMFSPGLGPAWPGWAYTFGCPANSGNCIACVNGGVGSSCLAGFWTSANYHTISLQSGQHFEHSSSMSTGPPPSACPGGATWQFGDKQGFSRTKYSWGSGSATMAGETIASYAAQSTSSWSGSQSISCGSSITMMTTDAGNDISVMESSVVLGEEGYADNANWICAYKEYIWDHSYSMSITPWAFAPYFNTFPASQPIWYTERYKVRIKTPDYDITWEFAEPDYGNWYGGGTLDSVDIWRMRIFDFHAQPVFVWTWKDDRSDDGTYAMCYGGVIYVSDEFPITGGQDYHDVFDAATVFDNGFGRLHGSAVGCRQYTHTEDGI